MDIYTLSIIARYFGAKYFRKPLRYWCFEFVVMIDRVHLIICEMVYLWNGGYRKIFFYHEDY
jgi:hypothetical protein